MDKALFAAVGFVAGIVVGAAAAAWYLQDEFAQQQRVLMTLHGDRRASACQLPEAQRPKNVDCRGLAP